jgi:hypothetical protein
MTVKIITGVLSDKRDVSALMHHQKMAIRVVPGFC